MRSVSKAVPGLENMNVDLRSDTVTRPTEEMYSAMTNAKLGDDVLGDDPTVQQLETVAAAWSGKESALFVPSGTMGNQIALACHTQPGDAILIEEEAHILYYEVGAPAMLSGVVSWTLPSKNGVMEVGTIEKRILKRDLHTPGTTLLCIENTHNRAGGTVTPLSRLNEYKQLCEQHGMKLHMDGARAANAAVAMGVPLSEVTRSVDSVSVCLSKGLCSPVGSVLCGDAQFIDRARIWRKRLGGGMRQAGILAACGLVSIRNMVERLAEDHRRAKVFADAIATVNPEAVDLELVQTNIVLVKTPRSAKQFAEEMANEGIHFFPVAERTFRVVFHKDIDDAATYYAAGKICEALK